MKLYGHLTAYILNRKWFNFSLEFFYQCMLTNAALQITQKTQSERRTNFNTSESSIDHEIWRTGSAHFMLSAADVISLKMMQQFEFVLFGRIQTTSPLFLIFLAPSPLSPILLNRHVD